MYRDRYISDINHIPSPYLCGCYVEHELELEQVEGPGTPDHQHLPKKIERTSPGKITNHCFYRLDCSNLYIYIYAHVYIYIYVYTYM